MSLPCFPFRAPARGRSRDDASGPDENGTRIEELTRLIGSFQRDLQAGADGSPAFGRLIADYGDFVNDWIAWRREHATFMSRIGIGDDLDRWGAQYNAFLARFTELHGKAPAAPPIAPDEPGVWDQLKEGVGGTLDTVASTGTVLIIGGAVAAYFLWKAK